MKLITSVQARLDGSVIAECDGQSYVFLPNTDGELECDVTDDADVAALLATSNFHPASEADFDEALALTATASGDDADDESDDDDLDSPMALPLEANTPAQPLRKRAAKGAQARA